MDDHHHRGEYADADHVHDHHTLYGVAEAQHSHRELERQVAELRTALAAAIGRIADLEAAS